MLACYTSVECRMDYIGNPDSPRKQMPVEKALEFADMKRAVVKYCEPYHPDSIYCHIEQSLVALADEVLSTRHKSAEKKTIANLTLWGLFVLGFLLGISITLVVK